ncbi:hypothetical protein ACLKA6_012022 [Drosophila palustris]
MSGTRSRINIYVPSVNRFPELNLAGGNGNGELNATELPSLGEDKTTEPSADAEIAAAVMEEELGVGGSGRSLYVIDSQGRLLEHVRYQGNDYRSALRAATNAMPNHWKD